MLSRAEGGVPLECMSSLDRIRRRQAELRVGFEVRGDAVGAGKGDGDEVHRLLQAVVGFGATEAEEASAGFAEVFVF